MDIPQGFKHTEVGIIPNDWEAKQMAEISISIASGKSKTKTQVGGEFPIYGSTGIIGFSSQSDYTGEKILVARVGANAGTVNHVKGAYCVSDNTLIISLKNEIDFSFIVLFLRYTNLNKMIFGSGQPLITGTQLKNLQIPLPPTKAEQTAIATALHDADALISSLERLIAKKRHIKHGAMQELLKPKAGWNVKKFTEIISKNEGIKIGPFGSQLKKDLLVEKGVKVYGQENVFEKNMEIGSRFIDKEHFHKLKSCELLPGDFIISMMGTIGRCMIVPDDIEKGIMDSHLIRLRLNKNVIDANFLYHFFSSESLKLQVSRLSVGGIMDGLSSKIVKNLTIALPVEIDVQQRVAHILSDMDAEIKALERRLTKYRLIKQGMMRNLLTGRIRLV